MKELERRTGVGRESIRGYLREGLIPEPQRPKRTVAVYGEEHVTAIDALRRLQADSRLTLGQIKELVVDGLSSQRFGAGAFAHLERLIAAKVGVDDHLVTLTSLVARHPAAEDDAKALASIGILKLRTDRDGNAAVSITDAELVAIWGDMRRAGFTEELRWEPAMLDFYVEAAKFVGGWEAKTFLERIEGRVPEEQAAAMAERALPLMLGFFGVLRRREFMRNVAAGGVSDHDLTPPGEDRPTDP